MTLFSSDRERRLWAWTLAVVAAIFSTLGLAGKLAGELRNRELFDTVFLWGIVLIAASIVTLARRTRPGGREVGVAFGVAAVYLMVFLRTAIPEERTHLIEYGVVAVLVHEALTERAGQGRRVRMPALVALGATSLVGVFDECIQAVLPNRVFDLRDIGFNGLAALMAVGASAALRRAWRPVG